MSGRRIPDDQHDPEADALIYPVIEALGAISMLAGVAGGAVLQTRRASNARRRVEEAARSIIASNVTPQRTDAWRRIAVLVPGTEDDLAVLKRHWDAIDAGLDVGGLTSAEHALRRALREDLPKIADALEETLAVAVSEEERRRAGAHALDSLQSLLAILNAHRRAIFDGAHDSQKTVGRYLDSKRQDVAPSGPLAIGDAA